MKIHFLFLIAVLAGIGPTALGADTPATVAIPDEGWHVWPDTQAPWKNDTLYLPSEVDLARLPVNPPTGGWDALDDKNGMEISLPGTVEEHFWGKFGLRPYTRENYTYGGRDPEVQNGSYEGVSWWWRTVNVPSSFRGKLALLHVRGARQRAEIYVNRQLVGYDLIEETSFDCDISKAIKPGEKNQIAIRITNPGGWYDWQDYNQITWGQYTFQRSHGFGGLDRGLTLTAHDPVYLADTWALNTPEVRTITAHVTVQNTTGAAQNGTAQFDVVDPKDGSVLATQQLPVRIPAASSQDFQTSLTCPKADLWDLTTPRLYALRTRLTISGAVPMIDEASRTFGFRWFEPRGVGQQAGLYLNDRRVRLYTAISWGFWGFNGLWPTPELADKEVRDAKQLNMNMLNFHRDIGKEEVLAKQDELGLLRYMEPGGGRLLLGKVLPNYGIKVSGPVDMSGKGGEPQNFGERYMEAKIVRMIRQFRSHPSLVIYVIQNEDPLDLHNPHVFHLLRDMHALDPSRVIAAKSGVPPENQAWFAPYATDPMADDGTGFSGWFDHHTVGGPGVWTDDMYQGPDKFTHQSDDRKEIVDWGEMLGAAVADNHPLMVRQIQAHGGASYDLKDHQEIADAYHRFLDQWGFRTAFPTDDVFFRNLGNKEYEFWGRVIETARLSECNDILTISGWESTSIENHSGLVDNLRNFKGDPALISAKLASLLPVVKPRGLIYGIDGTATLDLYLLNETAHPATGQLRLTLTDPDGHTSELGSYAAPAYVKDQFVYPVKMGLVTPALTRPGAYTLALKLEGATPAENSETIRVVQTARPDLPAARIGVLGGDSDAVGKQLAAFPQLKIEPYRDMGAYDLVVASLKGNGHVIRFDNGNPTQKTDDPALYNASIRGPDKQLHFNFDGLPPGQAKVSLYFCEQENAAPGLRSFDVLINNRRVVQDLDIFKEAGGANMALVKTFTVDAPQGSIDISAQARSKQEALFNAIKIEAGTKTVAVTCGGEIYTDKAGLVWQPYVAPDAMQESLFAQVKKGLPLLILEGDEAAADAAARQLAAEKAIRYEGSLPPSRASWMGDWVFVRQHPLYDGLPVNEIIKGDYQAPVSACYGLLVDGPGIEIVAAYSRDHSRKIGAITFTAKLGQGSIVFQGLTGTPPLIQQRCLGNALAYLLEKAKK